MASAFSCFVIHLGIRKTFIIQGHWKRTGTLVFGKLVKRKIFIAKKYFSSQILLYIHCGPFNHSLFFFEGKILENVTKNSTILKVFSCIFE